MRELLAPWGTVEWDTRPRRTGNRRKKLLVLVVVVAVAVGVGMITKQAISLQTATRFYVDPGTSAAQWVRHHPRDPRAARIEARIASQPQAAWLTETDPASMQSTVREYTGAAGSQDTIPILVAYVIPNRDCGGASSGGVRDIPSYQNWIDHFSAALGNSPSIVILEPDSLANIDCMSAAQQNERFAALTYAARTLHLNNPFVRVYYDSGHSKWESADVMAARLQRAGITRYGSGIALNVSNFNPTGNEIRYGDAVLDAVGDHRLGMVIDTSRNGNGTTRDQQFCDPPGRKVGEYPTANTGVNRVDAYLWVKQPGESDGCLAGAGQFLPEQAYQLVRH
jgi:endoglucanase